MTWLLTSSAREHYLTGPRAGMAGNVPGLREISHSLAQINRFTGHCSRPYSVAEHSMLVADLAKAAGAAVEVQLAALLHDAHECVTGDVASPIKQVLGEAWAVFEHQQQDALLSAWGLLDVYNKHRALIRQCDLIALATERRDLMPFDARLNDGWPILDTPGQEIAGSASVYLNHGWRKKSSWIGWAIQFECAAHALTVKRALGESEAGTTAEREIAA